MKVVTVFLCVVICLSASHVPPAHPPSSLSDVSPFQNSDGLGNSASPLTLNTTQHLLQAAAAHNKPAIDGNRINTTEPAAGIMGLMKDWEC